MEKRTGFIGIIVEQKESAAFLNQLLSRHSAIIRGRIGIPNRENDSGVIGLIVEGSNEEIGLLTGKIGNLAGVTVKSALVPVKTKEEL